MSEISAPPRAEPEAPDIRTPWIVASAASFVILAVALGLMGALGLFQIPDDDPGAKTIAAALALVGSIFATVVTMVGIVVRYSTDQQNVRLAAIEARRAHALASEAEQRNRIEAAICAVGLLGENNKDATRHQIGGAILALVSLGELALAVSLLDDLWTDDLVSSFVAEQTIRTALQGSSSDEVKITAATLLCKNAAKIVQDDGESHIWPIFMLGWDVKLPLSARLSLVIAAARWLRTVLPRQEIGFGAPFQVLSRALDDPHHFIRGVAAASLGPLTGLPAHEKNFSMVTGDGGDLSTQDILECLPDVPEKELGSWARTLSQEIREAVAQRLEGQ